MAPAETSASPPSPSSSSSSQASDDEVCGGVRGEDVDDQDAGTRGRGTGMHAVGDDVVGDDVATTTTTTTTTKTTTKTAAGTTTNADVLREYEATLGQKDFVMEPECLDKVKAYVASGGAPSTAIALLSENYRGYAAMTSLATHWLKVTTPPKRGVNTSPIKVSAAHVEHRGLGGSGAAGDANHATPTGGILHGAETAATTSADEDAVFDEMYFLETLVREKFDATEADRVFQGRPPAWLDGIFKSAKGRALLFSLAESNPNCLLISCAIQHAWQRGMRHEVRALGPAAAAYFSIFHELLADHIKGIISAGEDGVRRADAEERVKSMCCQSIGSYVFGQMMLASLARDENGDDATSEQIRALATRLSEEIEEAAAKLHGAAAVRRLAPWLAESAKDAAAKVATSDLLHTRPVGANNDASVAVGALAAGDLKKLRDLYFDENDTPSVAPLRHPDVLHNLIAEAFKWTADSGSSRQRTACFDLIALAVSDNDAASAEDVKDALNAASEMVQMAKRGEIPDKVKCAKAITVPSAAAGIIAAARSAMTNDDYHRVVRVGNSNAIFIELLGDIARKHVALQGVVLEALSAIINTCRRSHGDELVVALLDLGCDLVAAGHVMPTLTAACQSWRVALEASQMRYFANEVLEIAGPPYSRDFTVVLVRLLETSNSRKGMSKSVDEFVEEVRLRRREFKPPLGLDLVNTLEHLSR